jgi:glutamate formiminotransferase / 5-formyltetrahydrofolate cyclo-ligase
MPIVECIPNVSEGRRADVVRALAATLAAVPGVNLLDSSADASHNRSVFTFAGEPAAVRAGVLALFERALPSIDMRAHGGEHPRIGAVDVVPFVPLEAMTLEACVELARATACDVAERFHLPVYLYEDAALIPDRRRLEDIRRGGFEGLARKMQSEGWRPDYGPSAPHPTAGATAIGARTPLVAFNINLDTDRIEVAHQIAAIIRSSSGGLPHVKAIGVRLEDRGRVQVSINLTRPGQTSILTVFDAVKREAARRGVAVLESEIVGLVPASAVIDALASYLQLRQFGPSRVLDLRLRELKAHP